MKKILAVLSLVVISQSAMAQTCLGDQSAKPVRTVYIVPQMTATKLYVQWVPILTRLGTKTNQCFELVIPPTIPDFERALMSGRPDYAFMNPYHAVMAHKSAGYIPLVADSQNKLDGIIVVRADSPYKTLEDLRNKKLAFPSPNAFAASLLTRSIMTDKNIPFETSYVTTHSNVYRSVILGDVEAGGGVNNTFNREHENVRNKLRVLYRTPEYSPHPFSANPRITEPYRIAVVNAFVSMAQEPAMKIRLSDAQLNVPEPVTYKTNYAPIEKLNLERFVSNAN
jgi:phosphonate transport system substrate-binding protein